MFSICLCSLLCLSVLLPLIPSTGIRANIMAVMDRTLSTKLSVCWLPQSVIPGILLMALGRALGIRESRAIDLEREIEAISLKF